MPENRSGTLPGQAGEATGNGLARAQPVTTGYAMMIPAGWRQIPVRRGSERVIGEIASEVVGRMRGRVSRDKLAQHQAELTSRLTAMVKQARRGGAVDLYLPVQYIHGLAVPASMVVAHGSLGPPPEGLDAAGLVALLAAEGTGTTAVTVGGAIAARREHVAEPEQAQEFKVGSRRVDYMIPVPRTRDDWLIITFVTLGSGDPDGDFAKLLVEWFDAVVSTFEWTTDAPA